MDFQLIRNNFDVMHDSEQNLTGDERSSKSIRVSVGGKEYSIRTYTHTNNLDEKVVEIAHDKLGGHILLNEKDLKTVAKEGFAERIDQAASSEKTISSWLSFLYPDDRHNLEELVNEIRDKLDTIENDEYSQYAEKINSGEMSLFDYFGSVEEVEINELIKLAPHLEYVDLSDIEDKIEAQIEGGINEFLRNCQKMTVLKVQSSLKKLIVQESKLLKSIGAPNATELDCPGCTALESIGALNATKLNCSGCPVLTSIDAPNATELDCSGCPVLTSIDAPEATQLDCSGCTALESIGAPKVEFLDCPDCKALTSISTQNAKIIYCGNCTALISIDAPEAIELHCPSCTALESINAQEVNFLDCKGCTALTSIPAQNVIELRCYDCTALTSIDAPNATELNCSGCTKLISITAPKVNHLNCSFLDRLESIDAPNATELVCYQCSKVKSINTPNATDIRCSYSPVIESINAPNAKEITTHDCPYLKFIDAPNATKIYCNGCRKLESINAPSIIELYCRFNDALESINAPNATYIRCYGCYKLKSIDAPNEAKIDILCCPQLKSNDPEVQSHEINSKKMSLLDYFDSNWNVNIDKLLKLAPLLEYVDLSGIEDKIENEVKGGIDGFLGQCKKMSCLKVSSQSLTSIDAPNVTELTCHNCTALESINAPKVKWLDCPDCTSLTSITAPNVTDLNCSGCHAITSISAPKVTSLDCTGCTALTSIDAPKLSSLNSTYCWSLQEFTTSQIIHIIQIQKEKMKENPEQYLSQLIPYFLVNKQWPRVQFIDKDRSILPGIDASGLRKDAQTTLVQALFSEGKSTLKVNEDPKPYVDVDINVRPIRPEDIQKWRALGYIMGAAFKENFPTGGIFSPKVFETLKGAVLSNRDEDFKMDLVKTLYKEETVQYENHEDFDVDGFLKDYIPSFIDPIIALADGIKTILNEEELATFAGLEPSAIQDRIEGTLSADAIIGKLEIGEGVTNEVKEFLRTWIRNRANNPEALKAFLIAVTGSPTISPQMPTIKILHRADGLPASHTCFNQLELSNVPTQEKFDEGLEELIATAQDRSGFTFG